MLLGSGAADFGNLHRPASLTFNPACSGERSANPQIEASRENWSQRLIGNFAARSLYLLDQLLLILLWKNRRQLPDYFRDA
jgi:hypothetical protein